MMTPPRTRRNLPQLRSLLRRWRRTAMMMIAARRRRRRSPKLRLLRRLQLSPLPKKRAMMMTAQVCRIVFYFCSKILYNLLQMILMTSRPHQPKLLLRSPLPSLLLRKNPLTMTTATAMKRRRPNQLQQRSLQLKKNLPTMMTTIAMKRKRRSPLPSQLLKKLLLKTTATTVRTAVTRRKRRLQLRKLNQSRSPS